MEDAQANAKANRLDKASFLQADLTKPQKALEKVLREGGGKLPDVVVVDPPRSGLSPKMIEALRALQVQQIAYVSCK